MKKSLMYLLIGFGIMGIWGGVMTLFEISASNYKYWILLLLTLLYGEMRRLVGENMVKETGR